MIAIDTNLLLYAYIEGSSFHAKAAEYLQETLSGSEPVGIPATVLHAFLRLLTKPKVAGIPVSSSVALAISASWFDLPQVRLLNPGEDHWRILSGLAREADVQGDLFADAAIAAIAIEHGATVHTHDRDFARFPGLRWHNPLQP